MKLRKRNLQATRRSEKYRVQLTKAWNKLVAFTTSSGRLHPFYLFSRPWDMQRLLIAFIQHCYEGEADIHTARHAILVVQFLGRHLKGKLRGAWDSIESWSAEVESFLRPPLPVRALQALVGMGRMARVLGLPMPSKGTGRRPWNSSLWLLCWKLGSTDYSGQGKWFPSALASWPYRAARRWHPPLL